jgi:hypothetical protein
VKHARIEYELEGASRVVMFERDGVALMMDGSVPVLIVQVDDAEDADALVAAIEKVDRPKKARKRATKLPAPAAAATPPPASDGDGARAVVPRPADLPPRCSTPECSIEALAGEKFCPVHIAVPDSIKAEWLSKSAARTAPKDGVGRARRIAAAIEVKP